MRRIVILTLFLAAGFGVAADPGPFDWPQWRGPDRTNISQETGLLKDWPKDGPKLAWKIEGLGEGFSTPSISAGRIYVLGTKGSDEYMICLDEKNGDRVWDMKIGKKTGGYAAPKSTPTIDNGYAYVVSSDGNLVCADIKDGTIKWQKSYPKDFRGEAGGWAYTESPLIDGELVIGTPGAKDAALAAFKKADGEVVWKTTITGLQRRPIGKDNNRGGAAYSRAGYSSVVKAEIGGVKQYVQFIDGGVVGVNAADGRLLWHYEEPANTTANCSTPIVSGDLVFAASNYGVGGGQAKIVKDGSDFKAEQTYFVNKMQNHHGGMVLVKDYIYGTGGGSLICFDFKTGKIAWDDRSVGKGSVTCADGMLYVRGEGGGIALVEANPAKYVEHGQFKQPDRSKQPAWPHPVVANGKLYIRDWDILLCYDVKKK